jgi:hypothetical protein
VKTLATLSIIVGLTSLIVSQYFFKKIQLSILIAIVVTGLIGSFQELSNFYLAAFSTLMDFSFWQVIITIFGIFLLSELMKNSGDMDEFSKSIQHVFIGSELIIAMVPALIGLLPMPGGAMFTAPIVKEVGERLNIKADKQMISNYWFRHSMEFFWPMYPAIVLLAAFAQKDVRQLFLYQVPFGVLAFVLGLIFFISDRKLKFQKDSRKTLSMFYRIWPIILIIIAIFVFKIEGYMAVLGTALLYGILNFRIFKKSFLKSLKLDIFILFFLVFFYKMFLGMSGISDRVPKEIYSFGISPLILIPILPFISGLLTGVTQASIGMSFSAIAGIIATTSNPIVGYIIAYFFGVFGVLLSPLHICLILTAEYYKVSFRRIYQLMIPVIAILVGTALLIWLFTI